MAKFFPKLDKLVVPPDLLHIKRSRELGKAFAHPLVVITVPANSMAPPLMSDFVRRHITPEIIRAAARAQQLRPLGGVDKSDVRHEDQGGPGLAKKAGGLLGHRESRVGQLSKICVVDAGGILRISN